MVDFLWGILSGMAGAGVMYFGTLLWIRPIWEKKAIRNWYPPADFGDRLVPTDEELERLALRRELHDAGRLYPARDDAGRPARLHRAKARGKRSTL